MTSRHQFIRQLNSAFLHGTWSQAALLERGQRLIDESPPWLVHLTADVIEHFGRLSSPSPQRLGDFISSHPACRQAWADREKRPTVLRPPLTPAIMGPTPAFIDTALPQLATSHDLADWLSLTDGELDWFADCSGRQLSIEGGPLRHYYHRWVPRRRGPPRLLEIPKVRLKQIQRRILTGVLDLCPPHPAAHGFRKGRSCHGYAAPHCRQEIVLHMDLSDFFPSVSARRIHSLFRTLGYPWKTARLLTGLSTSVVPGTIFTGQSIDWQTRQTFHAPHLPQGAPTSPALANLAAFGLDRRLAGLARRRGLAFTRYADDLAFSGPHLSTAAQRYFIALVAAIALEEGFRINHRKTRAMSAANAQRLVGISINRFPNIPRDSYDRLKATLFNCGRFGPDSQNHADHPNFRAHLRGRIDYVSSLNPKRGEKLRRLFDAIQWPDNG